MGQNIISACHKCKVQIFHYRNEENKTILPFYQKHSKCAKEDIKNVVSVMDNNGTDQDWEGSVQVGGYPEDESIYKASVEVIEKENAALKSQIETLRARLKEEIEASEEMSKHHRMARGLDLTDE